MKTALLMLLVAVACTSCKTLANRRDMYTPDGQEGPYTRQLHHHHL